MPKKNPAYNEHKTALFMLVLATAIWGGALPIVSLTQHTIPTFTFLLFRFLLVGLVLLPIVYIELKETPIHKQDYLKLLLLGLAGQSSIAFIFWGVRFTTTLDAAIISTIAPLMTIFAGHHFYNERVNKTIKIGILIATIGTAIVVLDPLISGTAVDMTHEPLKRLLGNLLVLMYNVSFTFYIIWSKIVMGKKSKSISKAMQRLHISPMKRAYSPILHTSLTFYVALVTFVPLAIMESKGFFGEYYFNISAVPLSAVLGVLYMAFLSSIVAYTAYEWGLKKAQVTDGAIFGYLGPLFTLPFSYILLKELPTEANMFGALIIAIGVYIAEKNRRV